MIRLLLIALCVQVAAANTVTAAPFCVHAQSASETMQSNTADGPHHHLQAQAGSMEAEDDCPCHCDVAGHCAASAAGVLNSTGPSSADYEREHSVPSKSRADLLHAHKNRLYRPPSIT